MKGTGQNNLPKQGWKEIYTFKIYPFVYGYLLSKGPIFFLDLFIFKVLGPICPTFTLVKLLNYLFNYF